MKLLPVYCLMTFMLVTFFRSYSQEDAIEYSYDASGNRIERIFVIGEGGKGSCGSGSLKKEENEEILRNEPYSDLIGEQPILIYPNPAENEVTVELRGLEESKGNMISILDRMGRLVLKHPDVACINTLDLSNLRPGVYFMIISINNGTTKWTIIKQ